MNTQEVQEVQEAQEIQELDKHRLIFLKNLSTKYSKSFMNTIAQLPLDHILCQTFLCTKFDVTKRQMISSCINRAHIIKSGPDLINIPHNLAVLITHVQDHFKLQNEIQKYGPVVKFKYIQNKITIANVNELIAWVKNKKCITQMKELKEENIQKIKSTTSTTSTPSIISSTNSKSKSKSKSRPNINSWRKLRVKAISILGAYCSCCGIRPGMYHEDGEPAIMTGDHIVPYSKAPELQLEIMNIQVLCIRCNSAKGSDITTDFRTKEQKQKVIAHKFKYETDCDKEIDVIIKHHGMKITQTELQKELNMNRRNISKLYCSLKTKALMN